MQENYSNATQLKTHMNFFYTYTDTLICAFTYICMYVYTHITEIAKLLSIRFQKNLSKPHSTLAVDVKLQCVVVVVVVLSYNSKNNYKTNNSNSNCNNYMMVLIIATATKTSLNVITRELFVRKINKTKNKNNKKKQQINMQQKKK